MAVSAADVKRLREETDAPMMECKAALEEAGGDFEKAKAILREKGQAAAAKRGDRSTAAGIAWVAVGDGGDKVAGVVVECETDFVALNDRFKELVEALAHGLLTALDPAPGEKMEATVDTMINGQTIGAMLAEAVAVIRENIVLKKAIVAKAADGHAFSVYNHINTRKAASYVEHTGLRDDNVGFQIAIQVVAFPPMFLKREEVPADIIAREIEIETTRAVNEGKPDEVARKIAEGRVNKEYFQSQVLLEQPFYTDAKKKVADYVKENGGGSLRSFELFAVGAQ
jgi:elongation factor Ts